MTPRSAQKTAFFLLLASITTQGLQDVQMFHYKTKEALMGQNTSLTCFLENISDITVVSIEWKKKDSEPSKLALYSPRYGSTFSPNVTLKTIENDKGNLTGTELRLLNIDKGDAGTYVCIIATFPLGSLQKETELRVKDEIECNMNNSIEVNSAENVTILCEEFMDVTYRWTKDEVVVSDSSSLNLQSVSEASAGLYTLTVHTGNSLLQKAFNVTVSTQTTDASTPSPHLNRSAESETTRYSQDTTFATDVTQKATTIPTPHSQSEKSPNTSASAMYETTLSYNQSETHDTTLNYNESESIYTVSNASLHFNRSETVTTNTSYNRSVTIGTTLPFEIDARTENASGIIESTASAPTTATINPTSTPDTSDVTTQPAPGATTAWSRLGWTLLIIMGVFLIIVALVLCRRRVIKNRMDLPPPPFKPPPPPVKYTAVRNPPQPYPTDWCNSVKVQK
ncbi:uncharacterized protein [Eucyclogobius newberryi]|uniref:uncharacterized protein n=1 Tax=Eucyclogobius newberryi TaxID=166745 RepID=UPI003B5A456F